MIPHQQEKQYTVGFQLLTNIIGFKEKKSWLSKDQHRIGKCCSCGSFNLAISQTFLTKTCICLTHVLFKCPQNLTQISSYALLQDNGCTRVKWEWLWNSHNFVSWHSPGYFPNICFNLQWWSTLPFIGDG